MRHPTITLTGRSIRCFFGRYLAMLLIVMLSVGFFAGLKITKDAMHHTGDIYLSEQNFYDFRLLSTIGFSKADVEELAALDFVQNAEGSNSLDVLADCTDGTNAYHLMSLPESVNLPALQSGRLPETATECVADARRFSADDIGTTLSVSSDNDSDTLDSLTETEFTIVGIVRSPCYLGLDRGTTTIGSGALEAFFYLPEAAFSAEAFSEINITLTETATIYSDAYARLIETYEDQVTEACKTITANRYADFLAQQQLTPELAEQAGMTAPKTYVLTREENAGYLSFQDDTSIVSGIADVFPLFFVLIAMLVCVTTMTRMVDEERTQIGTLKAMGYSEFAITAKYLLYAASAAVIGWAIGFFLGTWGLPKVFWLAYSSIYGFAKLHYLFQPALAVLTGAVAVLSMLLCTWISCRRELSSVPAALIRPAAPKTGKRILLERITPLWNRLPFLSKVALRNMFRYKRRLVMMLIGTGCCAGLVVTAFGVRDSMIHVGNLQYEEIQLYDMELVYDTDEASQVLDALDDMADTAYATVSTSRVDVSGSGLMNSINLVAYADDTLADFWQFQSDGETLALPKVGEALINTKIAENLELSKGDTMTIRNSDMESVTVTISGIYDNYVENYVIVDADTGADTWGTIVPNTAFVRTEKTAEELTALGNTVSVTELQTYQDRVNNALSCLNYIIWMIVLFSGALAFIVVYNLTNINIAERSREIATVQVLGFYPKETNRYVLRENLILSILAAIIGLPVGTAFHRFVMSRILIDTMHFQTEIAPLSYVLSLICSVLFATVVNLVMRQKIDRIPMAESLKAVE